MAKRDNMADVMQALGIIADAASNIHSTNVRARLDTLDREARLEEREDRQSFQRELTRESWDKKIALEYPGVTIDSTGMPDFTGYDLPQKVVYTTRSHGWSTTKLKDLITEQTLKQNPEWSKEWFGRDETIGDKK